jgi:hypothetical protein
MIQATLMRGQGQGSLTGRERLSTIDLLILFSLDHLIFKMKNRNYLFMIQATLMRGQGQGSLTEGKGSV